MARPPRSSPLAFRILAGLLLAPGLVPAQEPAANFAKRFDELDRNGNGSLSREELPRPRFFARLDTNEDDAVTREEAAAFFRNKAGGGRRGVPQGGEPMVVTADVPGDAPVNLASCQAAADYSAQHKGFALLVQWRGRTIFERYDNGWSPERPHRLASGTKSFSGVLAVAAIEDGFLESFEERISDTITEWKGDPLREPITLRQLLSLHAGIDPGDNGNVPSYAEAIEAKGEGEPGTRFAYGPNAFQVFGEFLRRKLEGRYPDPLAYLTERVFEPIGLQPSFWRRDETGMPHLPSGAFLTAREWVKFGQLLVQEGTWNGRSLIAPEPLAECVRPSTTNPAYGITFWRLDGRGRSGDAPGAPDTKAASRVIPRGS